MLADEVDEEVVEELEELWLDDAVVDEPAVSGLPATNA